MENKKRYNIKNILLGTLWVLLGAGSIVLLVAAVNKKDTKQCRGIEVNISGVSNNFFIDKADVLKIINHFAGTGAVGKPIADFDLVKMESALKKDVWIKEAEMFFDNNEVLQVAVAEREPIARVFTPGGNTFYIDNTTKMLPLSEKFSARVPVFTGFPSEARILTKPDSSLLGDIRDLSTQIQADSFLMAMIDQVDITSQRTFEMVPKIGNQVIVFGDASDAAAKFRKLKLFYKKVMLQMGWSKYSIINLQYKNQVVAKIRGKDDVSSDSLRTIQMMDIIAANAARWTEDSIHAVMQEERKENDSSMIQQSLERDDAAYSPDTNEEPKPQERSVAAPVIPKPVAPAPAKPVVKPAVRPSAKPPVKPAPPKKAAPQKPKPAAAKPKAVMPKKNDY